MRPSSSTATPSLVCTPASDMDTPSSPTRKGLLGSSVDDALQRLVVWYGTPAAVLVVPGLPIDSAPAVSRPSSARMPMTSSGAAPSLQPDGAQLRRLRQQVRRPRQEELRRHAARRQRHQRSRAGRRRACAAIRGRRRSGAVRVHLDRADAAASHRRPAAQPRPSSRWEVSASQAAGRCRRRCWRPSDRTVAGRRRPRRRARVPSWQLGFPASSSRMKRRPTPGCEGKSSWRIFSASRRSRMSAPKRAAKSCAAFSVPCFFLA